MSDAYLQLCSELGASPVGLGELVLQMGDALGHARLRPLHILFVVRTRGGFHFAHLVKHTNSVILIR